MSENKNKLIFVITTIFLIILVFMGFGGKNTVVTKNSAELQTVDIPECGITVQFPKMLDGRPLLAYQNPEYAIGGSSGNALNGIFIGNPHMDEGENKIKNIKIKCQPIEKAKSDSFFMDWTIGKSEKLSNQQLKDISNWDISDADISEIYRDDLSSDWTLTTEKVSPQYTRTFYFTFDKKMVNISHLYHNDGSWFGFSKKSGLYPEQINVLPIGSVKADTEINKEIWNWGEPSIQIERKTVDFKLPLNDGKYLEYSDTYIFHKKNGGRLNFWNDYVQTKVAFEGKEIYNSTLFLDTEPDYSKPVYDLEIKSLGDYYSILSKKNGLPVLKSSVDGGKTWVDDVFFPDSYEHLVVVKNFWLPDECDKQKVNYTFCMELETQLSDFDYKNDLHINPKFKRQFINNPDFVNKIQTFKKDGSELVANLNEVICSDKSEINLKKPEDFICANQIFFIENASKPGKYDLNLRKTYEFAKEFTKNPKNKDAIDKYNQKIENNSDQEARSTLKIPENQTEYVGNITADGFKIDRLKKIPSNQTFIGDIEVSYGDFEIGQNAKVIGNIKAKNTTLKISDGVEISGNLDLEGAQLQIGNNVKINGEIKNGSGQFNFGNFNTFEKAVKLSGGSVELGNGNNFKSTITVNSGYIEAGDKNTFESVDVNSGGLELGNENIVKFLKIDYLHELKQKAQNTITKTEIEKNN